MTVIESILGGLLLAALLLYFRLWRQHAEARRVAAHLADAYVEEKEKHFHCDMVNGLMVMRLRQRVRELEAAVPEDPSGVDPAETGGDRTATFRVDDAGQVEPVREA